MYTSSMWQHVEIFNSFLDVFCNSRIQLEWGPSFILGQGNLQFVIRVASIPFYEDIILEGTINHISRH